MEIHTNLRGNNQGKRIQVTARRTRDEFGAAIQKAFTLSEVLITLGIIGVIAAITVPNLINSSQNKANEAAFKKMYSTLQNAINQVVYENGSTYDCYGKKDGTFSLTSTECTTFWNDMLKKLGSPEVCDGGLSNGCQPKYKNYDEVIAQGGAANTGLGGLIDPNEKSSYKLRDGSILYGYITQINEYGLFIIDVNGFKPPNKWGYDLFMIQINQKNNNMVLGDDYWWVYEKGGKRVRDILMGN